jgi:quinohemoprotein amine dehydrogenase
MARVGGEKFPKQFQQFEAAAYNRGFDNKPQTADDFSIGMIDADWSIDEFPATFDDDDKDYVGSLSAAGLFTPAIDGPNPKRKKSVNNYGDVWVVATYKPKDASKDAQQLKARSYLVVTVPLYVKWDQPEVSR